ncbi:MAG: TatD family hydrolase, partial [Candidatus Omnitrophica bacterium]|nr:TatD family hydrolase [Candidatus Omnitrophota bacterium]
MISLYDSHAHLDHLEDLDGALLRARQAGVQGIIAMSMDLASCRATMDIADTYKDIAIYPAFGMHPSETKLEDLNGICDLIRSHHARIVAVGEIGLDFWYKWVRKDDQKKAEQTQAYRRFLALAKELDLPVVIHSRGAWRECLDIALEVGVTRAEFHWYSGPVDILEEIIEAGYYVSTSPSVAFSP